MRWPGRSGRPLSEKYSPVVLAGGVVAEAYPLVVVESDTARVSDLPMVESDTARVSVLPMVESDIARVSVLPAPVVSSWPFVWGRLPLMW